MQTEYYTHIRRRFVSAVTIVVLVLAGLFYWYGARERALVFSSAEKRSASYASALKEHAERVFSEADSTIKSLIEEIDEHGGLSYTQTPAFYKRIKERSTLFSSIFVVGPQADIIAHSLEYRMKPVNLADREYFRYLRNNPATGLYISKPFKSKVSNTWRFSLSRPMRDAGGRFAGLVAITFETDYFEKFYKTIDVGDHGRIILLTTAGEILVHEPFSEPALDIDMKNAPLLTKYLPAASSGTYHIDKAAISQTRRIVSYSKLSSFPVVSAISFDYEEIVAPWLKTVYTQAGIGALLLLLFCVLSYVFLKQVRKLERVNVRLEEQQTDLELKAELLDAATDAILLLDSKGEFVYFNSALQAMTGYSREELLVSGLRGIEPPEYAERIQANITALFEDGEAIFESAYLRKSGSIMPIEVHARIMHLNDRAYVLSMVRDVTERKEIEDALVKNIAMLKTAELREYVRAEILEQIASGQPLAAQLSSIAVAIEKENPEMLCSILLVSDDGKRLLNGVAPSLPEFYKVATHRTRIGEGIGACGTAAFRRERVIVEDIGSHPFWQGFLPAQEAGLRSCWSEPILSSTGKLLGTFAIYQRTPATPTEDQLSLIQQASAFAGIAIERSNGEKERLELEHLLSQSQKMEAIGHLSGGIAHDFNNLLTPIFIYADMLKRSLPDNEKVQSQLNGIVKASGRARDLTQQLLSFGRKQVMQMKVIDLNDVIMSFDPMVRRTMRDNISLSLRLSGQPVIVRGDSSKLEQVLLNLVLNAQDAIAVNGSITIETGQILIDDEFARRHPGITPGRFVQLACADNGCGMSAETMERIFEPFFSTKEVGHGTGLGLANVYGIVRQHNGSVMAVSTVGVGTTFKIYLPICDEKLQSGAAESEQAVHEHSGNAVILLVEDNEMVREMANDLLIGFGYTVYSSGHPEHALELAREIKGKIDLVITDVVMPGMNGQQLFERITAEHPEIDRVLYMSGYVDNVIFTGGELNGSVRFLPKPFTVEALMAKVEELLEMNT